MQTETETGWRLGLHIQSVPKNPDFESTAEVSIPISKRKKKRRDKHVELYGISLGQFK